MRRRWISMFLVVGMIGAVATLASPVPCRAAFTVPGGTDFLHTDSTTTIFNGIPFQGVAFGPGNTDTTVQRLADATVANPGETVRISIMLTGLQLRSTAPVSLVPFGGTGTDFVFVTLAGQQPQGTLDLTFAPGATMSNLFGTFVASLPEIVFLRAGSLSGPILNGGTPLSFTLTTPPTFWSSTPPPGSVQPNSLFHPRGPWIEFSTNTHLHGVEEATVPEPGTLTMSGTAMLIVAGYAARRRKEAH